MKKIKYIILIIFIISVCSISYILLNKPKNVEKKIETVEEQKFVFKENRILYSNDELDILSLVENKEILSDEIEITLINTTTNEELKTIKKHFDSLGNEVESSEEFVNEKEIIYGIGEYKLNIKDVKNNKEYETIINIEDKTGPILEVKDISINEKEDLDISNFVVSCIDNSNLECNINLYDLEDNEIDLSKLSIGEHKLIIKASDKSNNVTKKEVTLNIIKNPDNKVSNKNITTKQVNNSKTTSNTNTNANTINNTNTKTNATVKSLVTTDASGYDTSNKKVSCATNMLGKKGVLCTIVAEECLNAIGKSLRFDEGFNEYVLKISLDGVNSSFGFDDNGGYEKAINFTGTYKRTDKIMEYDGKRFYNINTYVINKGKLVSWDEVRYFVDENDNVIDEKKGEYTYRTIKPGDDVWDAIRYSWYTYSESNITKIGTKISLNSMQLGDFVYYTNGGTGSTHIAVYIGKNKDGKQMAVHGGYGINNEVVIAPINLSGASTPIAYRVN